MVVGKTFTTLTADEIFKKYKETRVLSAVFPEITTLPCLISSPLREDRHPSFSIFMTPEGHIKYKDYANPRERGSLMDLLCKYWHCNFYEPTVRINSIVSKGKDINVSPVEHHKESTVTYNSNVDIQVTVRPWRDYDIEYWRSYGIEKEWLDYAEVYPISHKIVTKKNSSDDKGTTYTFGTDKYAYVFVERKEGKVQLKIYQPFNTDGYKWCSKMDGSVIGLWTKIPEHGERVVICSSLKDALCISCQLRIPTLCLQGEGYKMSETAVNELKRRYKRVYISFDTDLAGLLDSELLAKETGFINVVPDLGECKDYSDYYKSLEDKTIFLNLKKLFN